MYWQEIETIEKMEDNFGVRINVPAILGIQLDGDEGDDFGKEEDEE